MGSYYYIKTNRKNKKRALKLSGIFLICTGFLFSVFFFFPVVSYQLFLAPVLAREIESPLPRYMVNNIGTFGSLFSQGLSSLTLDYSDARNWYPNLPIARNTKVDTYFLSIPKLKIHNALVSTTDYDLSRHLVQYAGTRPPPENGTAVIFGHSTLPQLFDPARYTAIFATLHTLKIGDEVWATVDGFSYKYVIDSITITDSSDVSIFSQDFEKSSITLVTCTPPGTVWKRLVVRAHFVTKV